jgi:nickel transport protein
MERIKCGPASLVGLGVFFIVIIGFSVPALAHKATIFAWVEGDTVFTESKFGGGRRAVNSEVRVFDGKGRKLLTGKTNERGEFSFTIPELTDLKVVLMAGMGHRAEWVIPESELKGEIGLPVSKELQETSSEKDISLSREEVKKIVDDSLDIKLMPVFRKLAEMEERGPSITEILGGIGYIFGLMGVAIYFKTRGRRND